MKKKNPKIWIFASYIVSLMIFSIPALLNQENHLRKNIQERLIKPDIIIQPEISNVQMANGKAICNESENQRYHHIFGGVAGGAIIAQEDYRSGLYPNIYAQFTKYALEMPSNGKKK